MTNPRFRSTIGLLALAVAILYASRLDASERPVGERRLRPLEMKRVQRLVDEFRVRLSISNKVTVTLVEHNPLIASVQADKTRRGAFLLSLERGFAESLSAEELSAVIAHELGHVWIFTHHPYLQTESLANKVAMRVVARDRLEQVYAKVWKNVGEKGTVARFMEPAPPNTPAQVVGIAPKDSVRLPATPQR
jgi:hypothetical protein